MKTESNDWSGSFLDKKPLEQQQKKNQRDIHFCFNFLQLFTQKMEMQRRSNHSWNWINCNVHRKQNLFLLLFRGKRLSFKAEQTSKASQCFWDPKHKYNCQDRIVPNECKLPKAAFLLCSLKIGRLRAEGRSHGYPTRQQVDPQSGPEAGLAGERA